MTTLLIIGGIVAIIFIIRAINTSSRKNNKNELQSLLSKMHKEIFPNGKKDIDEGTKELLRILNFSIDEKTAENIFIKSSSICYITSMNNEFSKERLKQHLSSYALHFFNDTSLSNFYDYLLSKNRRAKALNNLIEVARAFAHSSNPTGTDKDEMPEGYGEFGLEITNPIPVSSIPDGYLYLNRLRTESGSKITYQRIGGMKAPNISHIVDAYRIFVDGREITKIYICAYNKKTSTKAPRGFILV